MITIHGFPLLHADQCKDLFSHDHSWGDYYFVKPTYTYLPEKDPMDDEDDRRNDPLGNIPEGPYLTALEVISDEWINRGFCANLMHSYGLILVEANPVVRKTKSYNDETPMVYLHFRHIALSLHGMKVVVQPPPPREPKPPSPTYMPPSYIEATMEQKRIASLPIRKADISTRAKNVLVWVLDEYHDWKTNRNEITVGEMTVLTIDILRHRQHCGAKTLTEIINLAASAGITIPPK